MEISTKYLKNNPARIFLILVILNYGYSLYGEAPKGKFQGFSGGASKKMQGIILALSIVLLLLSYIPLSVKVGEEASSPFTKDDEEKADKAMKKIKPKLKELLKKGKIWGYGTVYNPKQYGDKFVIHISTEKITPELLKKIPKNIDGIDVKWEQGSMPKAL